MTIKCAIVDDEPLAVELLASYVKKIPFMELSGKYGNAIDALNGVNDSPVDIIFLDIQMPELNGLELSKMLPENRCPSCITTPICRRSERTSSCCRSFLS